MQKKVMAVAVAAALAAPAAALAQGSSVQIYGGLSVSGEWRGSDRARTRPRRLAPAAARSAAVTSVVARIPPRTSTSRVAPARRPRARTSAFAAVRISATACTWASRPSCRSRWAALRRSPPAATACSPVGGTAVCGSAGAGAKSASVSGICRSTSNQTLGAAHAPYANASTSMSAGLLGGGLGSTAAATSSGQDFNQFCAGPTPAAGSNSNGNPGASPTTCFSNAFSFHRRQSNRSGTSRRRGQGSAARVAYGATSGATNNATNDNSLLPVVGQAAAVGRESVLYARRAVCRGRLRETRRLHHRCDAAGAVPAPTPLRVARRGFALGGVSRGRHARAVIALAFPSVVTPPTASAATIRKAGTSICATRSRSVSRSVVTTKPSSGT